MRIQKLILLLFLSLLPINSTYPFIYKINLLTKKLDKNRTQNIIILWDRHNNIVDTRSLSNSSIFHPEHVAIRETKKQIDKIISLAKRTRAQVLVEDWFSFNSKNRFADFIPKTLYRWYRRLLCYVKPGIKQTVLLSGLHDTLLQNNINSFNIENRQNIGLAQMQTLVTMSLLFPLFASKKTTKIGLACLLPTIVNPLYAHIRNKKTILRKCDNNTQQKLLKNCALEWKDADSKLFCLHARHIFDFLPLRNSWINDVECMVKILEQAEIVKQDEANAQDVYTMIIVGGGHAARIKEQLKEGFQFLEKKEINIEDNPCGWDAIIEPGPE